MKLKSITSILIAAGASVIYSSVFNYFFNKPSAQWLQSLFFFIAVTIVLYLVYRIKTDKKTFTGILLFSSVFKFLLSLIVIIIYLLCLKNLFFNFFIHFIGHYVLFTIFEIRYLLQLIKIKSYEN